MPTLLTHGSGSAYPPSRETPYSPLNINFAWSGAQNDDAVHEIAVQTAQTLAAVAEAEGQDVQNAPPYPNYAISGTPIKAMYGKDGAARLSEIREEYDPGNVMLLTGGWKFVS